MQDLCPSTAKDNHIYVRVLHDACVALEAKASRRYRPEHTRGLDAFAASFTGKRLRTMVVYLGDDRLATPRGTEVLPLRAFLDELEQGRLFG